MAVEAERGCGFRKIGGIYLEGPRGPGYECGRLPLELVPCVYCGQRVKMSRGLQRVTPRAFLHGAGECRAPRELERCALCPFDRAFQSEVGGLAWIGNRFYTPATFTAEAGILGVSKRLNQVPEWIVKAGLHRVWIFLAHRAVRFPAPPAEVMGEPAPAYREAPGIFYVFRPSRLVMVIGDDTPEETRARLRGRGLELVEVPHDDPDHTGADVEDLDDARQARFPAEL